MSDVTPLASELRLAVHRLTRRLRQQTSTDGLTLTQTSALAVIWREGPLSAGDLAAREQVRPPSITRVLAALESMGLVAREDNPRDGRQVVVRITPKGRQQMDSYVRERELWLTEQLSDFEPAEQEVLRKAAALLDRLAAR